VFVTSSMLSFAVGYSYVSRFFDNEAKKSVSHILIISVQVQVTHTANMYCGIFFPQLLCSVINNYDILNF
jgi:hypothetical protein